MRIHESHQRQKSIVGDSQNANFAVRLRNILHQPIDGVVGIGGVIDWSGVLRAMERAVHHVIAFRLVFAAYVLHHADVPALDNHINGIVITIENWTKMRALRMPGQRVGFIGRTRQQNRCALYPFWNKNHGVQPDSVPHRDHHFASAVVPTARHRLEAGWRFTGKVRIAGSCSLR